jgi:pimeloyl-ACP methyl ester carboxylesterase
MAFEWDEQGVVDVGGESVRYEMHTLDARSARQREQDARRGKPAGNILVVVPGHGQSAHGPKKLVATAAQVSRSKIVWCIDPVPARGGDRVEAQAIARVVRDRISTTFPAQDVTTAATLIGWSHGGSEALHAAEHDPDLFPQFLGLCPTGLVDRRRRELLHSFFLESLRILWTSARRRDWTCLKDTLRLGSNAAAGVLRDLWRGRSLRRLFEDIGWAASKVAPGPIGYPGEVVLLFGAQDTVVRWRDAFPDCDLPQNIPRSLAEYQKRNFPQASRIEVQVIDGAHVAPEVDAPTFLQTGLALLEQWDAAESLPGGSAPGRA